MAASRNAHCSSLHSKGRLSRPAFVLGGLAAGFAVPVPPVSAETITTDTQGLLAGKVKIPVGGGWNPGYRAIPATGGPFATIVIVHEISASTNISKTSAAVSPSWVILA